MKNSIEQIGDDAFVHTRDGIVAIDAADIPLIAQHHWATSIHGYAIRYLAHGRSMPMHRYILGLQSGDKADVDHINRDKADNRRSNLRIVTRNQNEHNKGKRRNNTSGFIGVCWDSGKRRWMAFAKRNYKFVCIGRFVSKLDAARAYDEWVIANRDEHAATNFPRTEYKKVA